MFVSSTAHEYYLKYDVNPTLVRILTDMCDIYMTSYLDCEPAVISEMNCIRELMESGAKSAPSDSSSTNLLPQCTNESITSLLGGALKVLLDCRFAMTDAVVGRYSGEMALLAVDVARHLQVLLLKLLRILKLMPTSSAAPPATASSDTAETNKAGNEWENSFVSSAAAVSQEAVGGQGRGREQCVQILKTQYSHLLSLTSATGSASTEKTTPAEFCQTLYIILEKLNAVIFLKQFLLLN